MADFKNVLLKIIFAVIIPIVGVPLFTVGYDIMNDSFAGTTSIGAGEYDWAVTVYTVLFILVFALVPIGLLYSIFKDISGN